MILWIAGCPSDDLPTHPFFRLNSEEQGEAIRRYAPDEAVDVCLEAMSYYRPAPFFDRDLASRGPAVLPAIGRHLMAEPKRGSDTLVLVQALHWMQVDGTYNVADDQALLTIVEHAVGRIKQAPIRLQALERLDEIKSHSPSH